MANQHTHPVDSEKVVASWRRSGGNVSVAARENKTSRRTVGRILTERGLHGKPIAGGSVEAEKVEVRGVPSRGCKTYIFTSAQNNTFRHSEVWKNLSALAKHDNAELFCATYSYNQQAYGEMAVKRGTTRSDERRSLWFDPELEPLFAKSDVDIELAPGLLWCGRMNILPTAEDPLLRADRYGGRKSVIFPHAKISMRSISSHKAEPTKFAYTTGTVTQRNYIQKRAGILAEQQHGYGGIIVEVTPRGWYVRQLMARDDGTIHDLDRKISKGKVTTGNRVEAINWGDAHVPEMNQVVRRLCWGAGGMLDVLRPRIQIFNDLSSFRARSPHEVKDCHKQFENYVRGGLSNIVEDEFLDLKNFLDFARRAWCESVIIWSNHDDMLDRWLKTADYRNDHANAIFFLERQLAKYYAVRDGNEDFLSIEAALRALGCPESDRFLGPDEQLVLCPDYDDGIEAGMHGHDGPGGARGSPKSFNKMGRRTNTGHDHGATLFPNGNACAGTCSEHDVGWNIGPSNWSWSHIVTHEDSTRQIVTMWNGGWRR